jgi:hypothetical protein
MVWTQYDSKGRLMYEEIGRTWWEQEPDFTWGLNFSYNGDIFNGIRGNITGFNIDNAVAHLNANAHPSFHTAKGQCAKFVRLALEAGGINTHGHPVFAKDYGPHLIKWGFQPITTTTFFIGDIAVIQNHPTGHRAGHIQMYNGSRWVSDFMQNPGDIWPGRGYRQHQPSFQIYRWTR